jgi:hypothetical protein
MTSPIITDIAKMLKAIPKDTPPPLLPDLLRPVLELLSSLDAATQTAILYYEIKIYFDLTNADIRAYEKIVKSYLPSEKSKKEKTETVCVFDGLIHLVICDNGIIKYLVNVDGKMEIKETVKLKEMDCVPKQTTDKCIKNLPHENILEKKHPYEPALLFKDIEKFLYDHIELPGNKGYMIPALWVLHTYIVDLLGKGATSPIMVFHGLKGSGKSRAKDVLKEIVFRALGFTHPSDANMYILPEMYKPTMLIDEITLFGKHPKVDLANLIKTRYKEGEIVARLRSDLPGNTADKMEFPCTFGATLFSTTEILGTYIDDRSIEFLMVKNERPEVERPIDYERAAALCDRLLYFRHYWMQRTIPKFETIARRRHGEILNPLFQMLMICDPSPERIQEFKDFTTEIETIKKETEYDTKQAIIFRAIKQILNEKDTPEFSTKEVVAKLNIGIKDTDPHKYNDNWTGRQINDMGFKIDRSVKTRRVYKIDDIIMKSLSDRFGIETESPPAADKQTVGKLFPDESVPF